MSLDPRNVACPTCGAHPAENCRVLPTENLYGRTTHHASGFHDARMRLTHPPPFTEEKPATWKGLLRAVGCVAVVLVAEHCLDVDTARGLLRAAEARARAERSRR